MSRAIDKCAVPITVLLTSLSLFLLTNEYRRNFRVKWLELLLFVSTYFSPDLLRQVFRGGIFEVATTDDEANRPSEAVCFPFRIDLKFNLTVIGFDNTKGNSAWIEYALNFSNFHPRPGRGRGFTLTGIFNKQDYEARDSLLERYVGFIPH